MSDVTTSLVTSRASFGGNTVALVTALVAAGVAVSLIYTPLPLIVLVVVPLGIYFISRPYELLLFMVFLIPFNFVFKVGPVVVAAELLKVLIWIPYLVQRGTSGAHFTGSRYNKWFAIWAGILILSVLRSNDLPYTIKESVRLASGIGLCYIAVNLVDSREKLIQIFKVLTVSTLLVACYGFYQFAIKDYGALFWIVNPRLDTDFSHGRFTFWPWRDRITSVLTSEMELGHYFNLCLPFGVLLWLTEGRKRLGSKWLLMVLATLAGLLLTFTFGAWLALAATGGLFALMFDKKRRWKMVVVSLLLLALLGGLVLFSPLRPYVEDKALGVGIGSFAWDAYTRLDSWIFAGQTWYEHPLLGVGVGNYEILEYEHESVHSPWGPSGSTPHETYLYLLADSGVIGLAAMLIVLLGTIRANLKLKNDAKYRWIATALAFALITNMIGWFGDDSTFFGPHTQYLAWLLVGLSEAVRNLAQHESWNVTSTQLA